MVWFGESLPSTVWKQSLAAVQRADLLLVVGCSGAVEPAASLVERCTCPVIVINPDEQLRVSSRHLHWKAPAAAAVPVLVDALVGGQA